MNKEPETSMKMKHLFLLILSLLTFISPLRAESGLSPVTAQLLKKLDQVVENKLTYREKREESLNEEKQKALQLTGEARQQVYYSLFKGYSRFQTDSAMVYLKKMAQTAPHTPRTAALYQIGRAEIYAVTGSYTEAQALLRQIDLQNLDHGTRLEFYHLSRTLYGWMADFAVLGESQQRLRNLTNTYRDSILLTEPAGINQNIVRADSANVQHRPELALQISIEDTAQAEIHQQTYIFYNMAVAYGLIGNRDKQMQYMARTAIADLENGTTEYEALPRLARLCYEANNTERAYRYLVCSMEDAGFCKARLRSLEASNIFPIIDRAYKKQKAEQEKMTRLLIYGLGLLTLVLVFAVVSLRRQMKRLSQTRKQLAQANGDLEKANKDLRATVRIKEEYIARYLSRCRNYIDTLEEYRRSLLKRFKAHQMEELYKELKSSATVQQEQERFFEEFDNSILNLYPHFVEQFNELLLPEYRITPKGGELLTTELRIFALIRLGVTDSQSIAHFLNYSVATIYCYRSKIRHQTNLSDNNLFEQKVMELG